MKAKELCEQHFFEWTAPTPGCCVKDRALARSLAAVF